MDEPIVFKCEDSLWRMLDSGEKLFDMRAFVLSDSRIVRLAAGRWGLSPRHDCEIGADGSLRAPNYGPPIWLPVEQSVSFVNKANGVVLTRQYRGMEFASWARGWCFLLLGRKVPGPA